MSPYEKRECEKERERDRSRAMYPLLHTAVRALPCPHIGVKWFLFSSCDLEPFFGSVLSLLISGLFLPTRSFFKPLLRARLQDSIKTSVIQCLFRAAETAQRRPRSALNPKRGFKTIFNHFRDKAARVCTRWKTWHLHPRHKLFGS